MYVMDDAVDETPPADSESAAVPVPPCCVLLDGGAGVRLEIADRGTAAGIVSIRPDDVLLQTRSSVANEKCNEEVLEWLSRALALRRSTLSVRCRAGRAPDGTRAGVTTCDRWHAAGAHGQCFMPAHGETPWAGNVCICSAVVTVAAVGALAGCCMPAAHALHRRVAMCSQRCAGHAHTGGNALPASAHTLARTDRASPRRRW